MMPSLLGKGFRRRKRRIKPGQQDGKTFRLYRAACHLLTNKDYEQVPVAHFAQAADMSVGAFYERFSDKDAFLGTVVALRLSEVRQRMEQRLDPQQWQHRSTAAVTRAIVEEMMRNLHGYGAGVVRAALKRGHHDRAKLEPLLQYRIALADQAVALLAERVTMKKPERAIRSAVQIAEATALDALLHERGPLRPGSWRMAATLSAMMLSMLALTDESTADTRDDDADAPDPADDDLDRMLDMPIEEVVAMPVPDSPPACRRARPREQRAESIERISVIRPTSAQPPPTEEKTEPPPRKRRHRPVI